MRRGMVAVALMGGIMTIMVTQWLQLARVIIYGAIITDVLSTMTTIYVMPKLRMRYIALLLSFAAFAWYGTNVLFELYDKRPMVVLSIIAITQISDVLQYLIGRALGKTKVGWISPKKTMEGYLGSFTITVAVTSFIVDERTMAIIVYPAWLLGIMGGLLSSAVKRSIGIKDYSGLLGPHGGWLDRTDSLYLPIVFARYFV